MLGCPVGCAYNPWCVSCSIKFSGTHKMKWVHAPSELISNIFVLDILIIKDEVADFAFAA